MHLISKVKQYWHFTTGLRGFFKDTISLEEAKKIVTWRMAHREELFLSIVKKGIYQYKRSPYLKLLNLAQCEFADLEKMVKKKGIEPTLRKLKEEGVYISFEEFKARKPTVRSGKVFHFKEADFDNPYLSSYYQTTSSGSTGAGTRTTIDLEFVREKAVYHVLKLEAHDVPDIPYAFWYPILPSHPGIWCLLSYTKIGKIPLKWFSPVDKRSIRPTLRNKMLTNYIIYMGRAWGIKLPQPEFVDLSSPSIIARWINEAVKADSGCLFGTFVTSAVRVCAAAKREGISLKGATFFVAGEPLTEAKLRSITAAGAKAVPSYASTELGSIGCGCPNALVIDDIHLFNDALALIQYPRRVEVSNLIVNSFFFTSLFFSSPKILLNCEVDDYGVVEERDCGCLLGELGFRTHLHHIRSFSKLTSEGMTLMGADALKIVEEVLPRQFGGNLTSYQILEEEDNNGFTRISILIDPALGQVNERAVKEVFFQEIKKVTRATPEVWRQAGTIQVKRASPMVSRSGKIMPLRVEKT